MSRLRRAAAPHVDALARAWSHRPTARRFVATVVIATIACAAITIAFAAISSSVQVAVSQAPSDVQEQVAPMLRKRFDFSALFVAMALIAAPLLESLLIAMGASLARDYAWPTARTVVVSGVVFGLLHGANGLLAIVPAALVFMVLTAAYIRWRPRSVLLALLAAAVPHLIVNAGVVATKAWLTA
jgi:membrane protease YdiL (CAAX protease family)